MARLSAFLPAKALIGMIHVPALPSSPGHRLTTGKILEQVRTEAQLLTRAGFDAILIENMHDTPYLMGTQDPAVTALMTACALTVKGVSPKTPLGIQILATGNREALAAAKASGAEFIRAENFVFSHVADEGLMPVAEAGGLLRYRAMIKADDIAVITDIKKKHASHAITADTSLAQAAQAAEFFASDGLVITGSHTGDPTSPSDLAEAKQASRLPIIVGSGTTLENLQSMLDNADAIVVGSYIKKGGNWLNAPDLARCKAFVKHADRFR